jgi:hypothetical protein
VKKRSNWQDTAELVLLVVIGAFLVVAIFWPLKG